MSVSCNSHILCRQRAIAARVAVSTAILAVTVMTVTTTLGRAAGQAGQTARAHKWQAGETVEIYALNPATHQYEWQKGVIKDVLDWGGAHVICNDRPNYLETIGTFSAEEVDATPPHVGAARYTGYKRGPATVQEKAKAAGICPCDPGIREAPTKGASQTALFKHLIWENYNAQVNGTLSAPLKVGVTFDTFNIDAPHTNDFGYLGNGVHGVEHSTAKQGERIYPVSTRFTLWRQYRDTLTQTQYDGHFDCFKEKSGAWVCGTAAGHQQIGSTR